MNIHTNFFLCFFVFLRYKTTMTQKILIFLLFFSKINQILKNAYLFLKKSSNLKEIIFYEFFFYFMKINTVLNKVC